MKTKGSGLTRLPNISFSELYQVLILDNAAESKMRSFAEQQISNPVTDYLMQSDSKNMRSVSTFPFI
jgi:hypothetical protein